MDTLEELEVTLDQLIENQVTFDQIRVQNTIDIELGALRKTQESLQAHLLFLSNVYQSIQQSIKARLSARTRERIYHKAMHYQRSSSHGLPPIHKLFQPSSFRLRKRRKTKSKVAVLVKDQQF